MIEVLAIFLLLWCVLRPRRQPAPPPVIITINLYGTAAGGAGGGFRLPQDIDGTVVRLRPRR